MGAGMTDDSASRGSGDAERTEPSKLPRPRVGESGRSRSSMGTSLKVTRFLRLGRGVSWIDEIEEAGEAPWDEVHVDEA